MISTSLGSPAGVDLESTSRVWGDAIMLRPFSLLSLNYRATRFFIAQLPPRPVLDLDRARDPPRDEVDDAFPAAKNLGLTGHLRFQQERAVIDPGRDQDRFRIHVGATERGRARGRLANGTEHAGTRAGIDLSDGGNGGDRPPK